MNSTGVVGTDSGDEVGTSNRYFSTAKSKNVMISLREEAGPVLDQGSIGSCVENALVSAVDIAMRLANHPTDPLSRMQSYADTRQAQNTFDTDFGSYPEVTLDMATTKGLAYESSWKYDMSLLYKHPTQAVVDEAAQHLVLGWQQVNPYQSSYSLRDSIAGLLDQGKPVILAFKPHYYFFNEQGPLDKQINFGTDSLNVGHAVVIVGVDDNLNGGSYIVKNSWGTGWGDNGYGTIKYTNFPTAFPDDFMGAYVVTGFNGIDLTYSAERVEVANNYAVILQRAGEISGVDYWANMHLSDAAIATSLINSAEGQKIWGSPSTTNAQFVEKMYEIVLGRHSDTGGLKFYVDLLDKGWDRGTIVASTMNAIEAPAAEKGAHDLFVNRANVADYISIAMQYNGGQDSVTHDVLSHVTSDANAMEIIKIGIPHTMGWA